MKRVGQVLKETRLKKNLTLTDVEKETKIRQPVIFNLEEGNYAQLPPPTFIKGLIKNYGDFLGLPTLPLLALFRREFAHQTKEYHPKTGPTFSLFNFKITPNLTIFSLSALAVVALFAYLIFQYLSLSAAPSLKIIAPTDNITVTTDSVEVVGKTEADVVVTINMGKIDVDQDGNFESNIKLISGQNTIEIVATNKFGKSKKITRRIQSSL